MCCIIWRLLVAVTTIHAVGSLSPTNWAAGAGEAAGTGMEKKCFILFMCPALGEADAVLGRPWLH